MKAETFAKELKWARFCRCKRTILVGTTKIIAGYSHMCEKMSTCLVLLLDKMLMVAFGSCVVTHIIDLLTSTLSSLAVGLLSVLDVGKSVSFFGFLRV